MEIKVIKVETGAEFDGVVWDYWVDAILPNNLPVKLFDYQGLNLSSFQGKIIDVNLKALFIENNGNNELLKFNGIITKKNDKYFLIDSLGIEIELKPEDIDNNDISVGKQDLFFVGRLDIDSINEKNIEAS